MLDLIAAFDTVDYCMLLQRLSHDFSVSIQALTWFASYLHDRTQSVHIHEASSLKSIFSINIAPVADIIGNHGLSFHSYANDQQIYVAIKPCQDQMRSAIARVEACVADVRDWMLNDDKTEVILFGSAHQLRKVELANVKIGDTSVNVSHRV